MAFAEARAIAPRNATATVARFQRATDRKWNAAALATDVEWLAFIALDDTDPRRIARKPASRIERERGAVFELAAMRTIF